MSQKFKTSSGILQIISTPGQPVEINLPPDGATETKQNVANTLLTSIDGYVSYLSSGININNFPVTQPISATSLPLPSGASTEAKQDIGNSSLSSIDAKTPILVSGRQPVDGSGVTQPISAISLPLPTGASTSSNQTTTNSLLTSIDGYVSTLTTGIVVTGIVNNIDANVLNFPAVQAISATSLPLPTGAATSAKQDTGNASLASIDGNVATSVSTLSTIDGKLALTNTYLNSIDTKTPTLVSGRQPVDGSGVTQPISVASLPLPTGASTETKQDTANSLLTSIDGYVSYLASGLNVTVSNFPVTQPISAVSLPLPSGAATSLKQDTGNTSLSSIDTNTSNSASSLSSIDGKLTSGVTISNFPATQPISAISLPLPTGASTSAKQDTTNSLLTSIDGYVSNLATGVPITATSLPLPAGASTSANQVTSNNLLTSIDGYVSTLTTGIVVTGIVNNVDCNVLNFPAVQLVDGSGVTQPISAASLPLPTGAATSANQTTANSSLSSIDGKLTAGTSGTATNERGESLTPLGGNLSIGTSAVQLSTVTDGSSTSKACWTIYNTSAQTVYIGKSGVTTSTGYPITTDGELALPSSTLAGWYGIVSASTSNIRILGAS